jgi:hypothetical protein
MFTPTAPASFGRSTSQPVIFTVTIQG